MYKFKLSNGANINIYECDFDFESICDYLGIEYYDRSVKRGMGNWDEFDPEEVKARGGKIFPVDAYIHSDIALSLHGEGMQCRWDTSSNFGVIVIYNEENPEQYARKALEYLSDWMNGYLYELCSDLEFQNDDFDMVSCGLVTRWNFEDIEHVFSPELIKEIDEKWSENQD